MESNHVNVPKASRREISKLYDHADMAGYQQICKHAAQRSLDGETTAPCIRITLSACFPRFFYNSRVRSLPNTMHVRGSPDSVTSCLLSTWHSRQMFQHHENKTRHRRPTASTLARTSTRLSPGIFALSVVPRPCSTVPRNQHPQPSACPRHAKLS